MIKPYIHYIIYGTFSTADFASMHWGDFYEKNPGMKIIYYEKDNLIKEALSFLLEGPIASMLDEENPELADLTRTATSAIVFAGNPGDASVENFQDINLDSVAVAMHPAAISILDLLTIRLFSSEDWYQMQEGLAVNHDQSKQVMMYVSPMSESIDNKELFWLHSRGMLKFGLPDLSMKFLPYDNLDFMYSLFSFLINELAYQRIVFNNQLNAKSIFSVPLDDGSKVQLTAVLSGSPDDDDFNNYHLEIIDFSLEEAIPIGL